jgi:hypothetical protein
MISTQEHIRCGWIKHVFVLAHVAEFLDQKDIFLRCWLVCTNWHKAMPLVNWSISAKMNLHPIRKLLAKFATNACPQILKHLSCSIPYATVYDFSKFCETLGRLQGQRLHTLLFTVGLCGDRSVPLVLQNLSGLQKLERVVLSFHRIYFADRRSTTGALAHAYLPALKYCELQSEEPFEIDFAMMMPNLETLLLDGQQMTILALPASSLRTLGYRCSTSSQMRALARLWALCPKLENLSCLIRSSSVNESMVTWVFPTCLRTLKLVGFNLRHTPSQHFPNLVSLCMMSCVTTAECFIETERLQELKIQDGLDPDACAEIIIQARDSLERIDLETSSLTRKQSKALRACTVLREMSLLDSRDYRVNRKLSLLSFPTSLEVLYFYGPRLSLQDLNALASACPLLKELTSRDVGMDVLQANVNELPNVVLVVDWPRKRTNFIGTGSCEHRSDGFF